MAKRPVSVTLETDNLVWLRGRAGASGESVSQVLDDIVTAARIEGRYGPSRSVAGTIDIDVACQTAIAGKPAPTMVRCCPSFL